MQGVDANGKDYSNSTRAASRTCPLKLFKPLLLLAVLATGFAVSVAVLLLTTSKFSAFSVPDIIGQPRASASPCVQQPEGQLGRWVRPPESTAHNMTDDELLWAASFEPGVAKYPYKRVPRVAFMFLTRGPLPLAPLWEKFFSGSEGLYSIYVHALPGYQTEFTPTSVFYRRQVPSQEARWGETSMCDAERRLLANALLDAGNERFVLLSESCIPLYSFPVVYTYLTRSRHSFVGAFDDPGPHGRGRYRPGMAPVVVPEQWRKGAQWFEVDRRLAVDIVSDATYYPKFRDFCRPPCYVDEHYLPTFLSIEAPHRIANRTVTWVDWSRGGAHPATFGGPDVSEVFLKRLLQGHKCLYNSQPSDVCFLFARKFAPSALEPLLRLAPSLLGFG